MSRRRLARKGVLAVGLIGLLVAGLASATPAPAETPRAVIDPGLGIFNLKHVVFIVQENRSFDHYFGTFPGANGIPKNPDGSLKPCVPDPKVNRCRHLYHDTNWFDEGGPHNEAASNQSINGGKMNGFVNALRNIGNGCKQNSNQRPQCRKAKNGPGDQPDVLGYHTAHEIPNYWKYAKFYTLQDRMFAPADSWTLPAHLYLVSAWSAYCSRPSNPMTCRSDLKLKPHWNPEDGPPRPYAWADITWLLHKYRVSWRYYVGPGTCVVPPCGRYKGAETIPIQSPLPGFRTVAQNKQLHNVTTNTKFFKAAKEGRLPAVSWVMPTMGVSEHPPDNIRKGQKWVTNVVNAILKGPHKQWLRTAIFITWDDWGGFYDHVPPLKIDENGYGIRVPGIMISPWSKRGFIDHQTLSFDAYLKFIEDLFLGSQRLDPATDGWPDPRPTVREEVPQLGDISNEFDFYQTPLPPLVLDPTPF